MDPKKDALPFIERKFDKYGIEWINKGRVSNDFKFLIYGRPNRGKQIGIYKRETTVIRLEKYDQKIDGVTPLPKCAITRTAECDYSNFKNARGVCVEVINTISLEKLLDWYFGVMET